MSEYVARLKQEADRKAEEERLRKEEAERQRKAQLAAQQRSSMLAQWRRDVPVGPPTREQAKPLSMSDRTRGNALRQTLKPSPLPSLSGLSSGPRPDTGTPTLSQTQVGQSTVPSLLPPTPMPQVQQPLPKLPVTQPKPKQPVGVPPIQPPVGSPLTKKLNIPQLPGIPNLATGLPTLPYALPQLGQMAGTLVEKRVKLDRAYSTSGAGRMPSLANLLTVCSPQWAS